MIDVKKIDSSFFQQAGCCLFSSYAIALNYFSNGQKSVQDVFNDYTKGCIFGCAKDQHKFIENKYHSICISRDFRGTEYVCMFHKISYEFSSYCSVDALIALRDTQSLRTFDKSIDLLKTIDGLALVVYRKGAGFHTVVLGCDLNQDFFIRDPNYANIISPVNVNTYFNDGINELLLFRRRDNAESK